MSTVRQRLEQIKVKLEHLNELENLKSSDKDSLKKAHNSVEISFRQMLDFIDHIIEKVPAGDIRKLLDSYRSMTEMFYAQVELTLLMELAEQNEIQEHAESALKFIEGLPADSPAKSTLDQVAPQLVEARDTARDKFNKLREQYPTWLQRALNKLRDEWQRLHSVAVANQALAEDQNLDRAIKAVVEVAAHSVGVEAERIAIIPGDAFALNFFTYLDNLAVLVVPIYSVQSLWEWSIFWHELAGYKVRRLEKTTTIEKVRQRLTDFHQLYKVSDEQTRGELLKSITWDNEFCRGYFEEIFRQERPDLTELGGFAHQFDRMVLSLTAFDRFQAYDQIKADGWCVDWFKELFEDAWSVLTIGEPFLDLFENILARNASKDARHPPLKVRMSVAKELLKLLNPQTELKNDPTLVEGLTAQQILKFIALLRAAARQYPKPEVDPATDPQLLWQRDRDQLFEKVSDGIQEAIETWFEKFLMAARPITSVRRKAKDLVEIFSDPEVEELVSRLHQYEANQIKSSYRDLLDNRNYAQLLQLSFVETDYHTPTDIRLLESGRSYWVRPADWMSWSAQRRPAGTGKLTTEITITEADTGVNWNVKTVDWLSWFKMTQ